MPLTPKQERFVAEYLIDLNATQAAIRAGYSAKTARQIGQENLSKPVVQAAISTGKEKQLDKLGITADRVLQEIAKLAFSNMGDYIRVEEDGRLSGLDFSKLTREQAAAIQEVTEDTTGGSGDGERRQVLRTRFKLADKGINLERLGKHLKLFTDKQ